MIEKIIEKAKTDILYIWGSLLTYFQKDLLVNKLEEFDNVSFLSQSPNVIIRLRSKDNVYFIREARKHLPLREYVNSLIDDFFKYVYTETNSIEAKKLVLTKLSKKKCFSKFVSLGKGTSKTSNLRKFRETGNPNYIGFYGDFSDEFIELLYRLVQFVWGSLDEFKYHLFFSKNQYHRFSPYKSIVTQIVAEYIDCGYLIPKTELVEFNLDGILRHGVSIEDCKGFSPFDLPSTVKISPLIQRDLLNLCLLDVIMNEKDHRPGNYFVQIHNDIAVHIKSFDNDCPSTLFPSVNIEFQEYIGTSPLVLNGLINRPFLDRFVVDAILNKPMSELEAKLKGILPYFTRKNMLIRLSKLKTAIQRSLDSGTLTLLDENEWNQESIEQEKTGKYGVTYFLKFLYCLGKKEEKEIWTPQKKGKNI